MLSYLKLYLFFTLMLLAGFTNAQQTVERWGTFELTLKGSDAGNPFIGTTLSAEFRHENKTYRPDGFYDGNGIYKIRFMPDEVGEWSYITMSNKAELNDKKGTIICTSAQQGNHGPVRISKKYHFAYADSSTFTPLGTTCYEWAFRSAATKAQTVETLKSSPFNKVRMLAIAPYKADYIEGGKDKMDVFPFEGTSKDNWDFSRFNPEYFRRLEECIVKLRDIGIQADLILFRPYDKGKWGFDQMDDETNQRFIKYMVARFSAYRNIWWSMANENSFIKHLTDEDWDRYFQVLQKADPYSHLRSMHNADRIYDYGKPWVTHVSMQYYNAARAMGVAPLLRDIYHKPIVLDEINYEGDIPKRWGHLTGEEMTYRFWVTYIGGGYATHGEALGEGWISGGGTLIGKSPKRIAFLKNIIETAPRGIDPIDQYYVLNAIGKAGQYYLFYLGTDAATKWDFILPSKNLKDGMRFKVEVIDTWNMTITPISKVFELKELDHYKFMDKNKSQVKLPGKPYMALRITKVE